MLHRAYIALGSNVGDRRANLAEGLAALAATSGISVLRVATAIETEPVDCPPGSPRFLNTVAEISTTLSPHGLLRELLAIESSLGRERSIPNAPRPIDLDLLLFGDQIIHDPPTLILPHPRMHERRFVLEPLAQIAPDVVHPVLKKSIAELLAALPA